MRIKSIYKFLFIFFLFTACAQDIYKKGNEKYDDNFHAEAIPYFEKILTKKNDAEVMIKLANCYKQINDFNKAEEWYRKVISSPEGKPVHKLYLAQVLRQNNKCSEALQIYSQYLNEKLPGDRVLKYETFCEKDSTFISTTHKYSVEPLSAINSGESSYGPAFNKDGIVFLSNMNHEKNSLLASKDKGLFYDIYYAKYTNNGFTIPEKLKGKVNTQYHEGPVTFNKDYNEMYFTRSNFYKNRIQASNENVNSLKIYKAVLENDQWTNITEFSYNSDKYSVGHPALSKDGNYLFFSSDMPGGFGGTDIYKCTQVNGKWSTPINLGNKINTSGNELFPFVLVTADSMKLYFSSDGHTGLGGLDIYSANYKNKEWQQTAMLPFPVNSYGDDFGFIADDANQYGFFSSNRFNTNGIDKLYRFEVSPLKELYE